MPKPKDSTFTVDGSVDMSFHETKPLFDALQSLNLHPDSDAQFNRQAEPEPEIKLLQAILEEAIGHLADASHAWRPSIRKAVKWIESDLEGDLFSFVSICEALGVDPSYMRKGLRAKYPQAWLSNKVMYVIVSKQRLDYAATTLRLPLAEVVKVARLGMGEWAFKRALPPELWQEYPYAVPIIRNDGPTDGPVLVSGEPPHGSLPGPVGDDLGTGPADSGPISENQTPVVEKGITGLFYGDPFVK